MGETPDLVFKSYSDYSDLLFLHGAVNFSKEDQAKELIYI